MEIEVEEFWRIVLLSERKLKWQVDQHNDSNPKYE